MNAIRRRIKDEKSHLTQLTGLRQGDRIAIKGSVTAGKPPLEELPDRMYANSLDVPARLAQYAGQTSG